MEDARSWAASLLSVLRGEAASEPSQLLLTAPGDRRTSSQPLAREDLRPREEARASGFRGWRSPPALLSGALSRRRRCRTSVLWATEAREMSRAPAGWGRGGHVTPPLRLRPRLRLLGECFPPARRVAGAAPTLRGCFPSRGSPESREPEGRFGGGGPPQFLCLPGGGAIFARWAPKSRKS